MTPDMKELPAELVALVAEIARLNDVVIPGMNRQLTEQFELSTKYVALHEQALRDVERYKVALTECDEAISEMFRYYDGGETRGSYDGKPERAQLRKAGYAARQALKSGDPT